MVIVALIVWLVSTVATQKKTRPTSAAGIELVERAEKAAKHMAKPASGPTE
jgi:hypothetical protein